MEVQEWTGLSMERVQHLGREGGPPQTLTPKKCAWNPYMGTL